MSNKTKGIYFALLTAFISGVAIFVNKFAADAIKPAVAFTAIKNSGVGLTILLLVLASGKWKKVLSLSKKDIISLITIGIIGGSIPFYLFFTGLTQIPAINGAIIHKTLVLWVAILAYPFLKERLSVGELVGVGILFASNYVLGGFKGFKLSQGELFILLATLMWAVETIIAKKVLSRVEPDLVVLARMGFGSLILVGMAWFSAPKAIANGLSLTSIQWFWLVLTLSTLLLYVMSWYRALRFAPAVTVSAILVSATLITNILSAVFVTHTWNLNLTLQSVLIILGSFIYVFAYLKTIKNTQAPFESKIQV